MNVSGRQATLQAILHTQFRSFRERHALSPRQWQVCNHIMSCRTGQLGSVYLSCSNCDHSQLHHHACRDRHCPQCQQQASQQWSEKQAQSLLPEVTYHHIVFTLPHELNGWIALHPREIYGLLFQTVWSTLKRFGENPKYLGGQIGVTSVLHTWGENLSRHAHLHCLVPGGALDHDGEWISGKGNYLFPVRALSRGFRGSMVSALRAAAESGQLDRVTVPGQIDEVLDQLMKKEWVVYSKPCEQRAERVVQYLGRYTHRIAISNERIEYADSQSVRFSVKQYRENGRRATMTLSAEEFVRRFLMHVLPKGLMRIRHYGLLSNRTRQDKIAHIRECLKKPPVKNSGRPMTGKPAPERTLDYRCPRCRTGRLHIRLSSEHGPPPEKLMN